MNFVVWIDREHKPRLGDRAREQDLRKASLAHDRPGFDARAEPAPTSAARPRTIRPSRVRSSRSAVAGVEPGGCLRDRHLVARSQTCRPCCGGARNRSVRDTAFRCFFEMRELPMRSSTRRSASATPRRLSNSRSSTPNIRRVSLRDLAWMRLHPWQDIIAHFFDDPALREELFSIRERHDRLGLRCRSALPRRLAGEPARLDRDRAR